MKRAVSSSLALLGLLACWSCRDAPRARRAGPRAIPRTSAPGRESKPGAAGNSGKPRPGREASPRGEIARLIAGLGHDDWRVRERASQSLRRIGERGLPALREALESEDAEVRYRADLLIGRISRDVAFSKMGNTLIADTYGGRVVEVEAGGREIWSLEGLKEPVVAQRLGGKRTLVAERAGGRVTVYDRDKKPLWQMEGLGQVWHAVRLKNGHTLMTCCGAELFSAGRVLEVDENKKVVWEMKDLAAPRSCQRLPGGNTLIVERKKNRVIEVDAEGKIVWKVESLNAPLGAVRLPGGNTLISEWRPARAIEVDAKGKVVWKFSRGLTGTGDAQRLENGHTLITDFGSSRVIQVDGKGNAIWEQRGLHSPCGAVRIGGPAGVKKKP